MSSALLRGNDAGWDSGFVIGALTVSVVALALFAVAEVRQIALEGTVRADWAEAVIATMWPAISAQ